VGKTPGNRADVIGPLQNFSRLHQYGLTRRGEQHLSRRPLDQYGAEFGFQLLELGRKRGLADKAGLGRMTEMPLLIQRHQITQVSQVHGKIDFTY